MSLFAADSPDLILLAEDEARMLGSPRVEPEHLLLAFSRRGRVRDLLGERGVRARELYEAVVDGNGVGDELVLGRLPRSLAAEKALQQAVVVAAERGERRPDSVHVLLALAADERVRSVLHRVGLDDLTRLVDDHGPPAREPLSDEQVRGELVRAAMDEWQRPARAPVPAFERFTPAARRAIRAAAETAALLEHREVDPFHLLIGCLRVPESFAARVLSPVWEDGELGAVGEAVDLACRYGPHPFHQATGAFSETARRVVAEDALKLAYRLSHAEITTGHLLLATLDSHDPTTTAMTRPQTQQLARTLTRGLPGTEHGADEGDLAWIQFDALARMLTLGFRRILPPGWTIMGSARSDIHLRVPDSRSESDFQIRPGWIAAESGPAPERLRRVTQWMLERLQAAVIQATGRPWPESPDGQAAPVYAQLIDDRYNPKLRLGYGHPESPVTTPIEHDILLNMVIGTS
jgi:Clp amino terminal domain, pathogenicity island component